MLPALEGTLSDLGIDLRSQRNVELDIEQREKKTPRAFCAPIEIPGRVVLVIQPIGGADDWRALFHEAGHIEHFANTSPDLAMEDKRLGDNAVTEGWAMLLQHLTDEPRLAAAAARHAAAGRVRDRRRDRQLLYFVRRYAAKLLYEIEFHAAADLDLDAAALRRDPRATRSRSSRARRTTWPTSTAASTSPSTCARGRSRRSSATTCARSSGTTGSPRREAGSLLRELWSLGQRYNADELLEDVTGARLQMVAVAERVREVCRRTAAARYRRTLRRMPNAPPLRGRIPRIHEHHTGRHP